MAKQKERTPLRKAVDQLKADGLIRQDKDLQEIFHLSKSTISAYLNGNPGKEFVREFESHFKLSLNEFEGKDQKSAVQNKHADDLIAYLKKHIESLEQENKDLKNNVNVNLGKLLENHFVFDSRQEGLIKVMGELLSSGDKKQADFLLHCVGTFAKKFQETGSRLKMDNDGHS